MHYYVMSHMYRCHKSSCFIRFLKETRTRLLSCWTHQTSKIISMCLFVFSFSHVQVTLCNTLISITFKEIYIKH